MSKIAIYAGTFNPITYGHLDILSRALKVVDELIVAIAESANKHPFFSLTERSALVRQVLSSYHQVKVITFDHLLVDLARSHGVSIIIRGIRNSGDFEYEQQLASLNRAIAPEIETVFLLPSYKYAHISATLVREVCQLGGDISAFVPVLVENALKNKFKEV